MQTPMDVQGDLTENLEHVLNSFDERHLSSINEVRVTDPHSQTKDISERSRWMQMYSSYLITIQHTSRELSQGGW